MIARQKGAKKRSLHGVNEHFELRFNAVSAALGINKSLPRLTLAKFRMFIRTTSSAEYLLTRRLGRIAQTRGRFAMVRGRRHLYH